MTRAGFPPLTAAHGVALFDAALAADRPLAIPMRVNRQILTTRPDTPPLLHDLVPTKTRRKVAGPDGNTLATHLAALTPATVPLTCWTWSVPRSPECSGTPAPTPSPRTGRSPNWASTP